MEDREALNNLLIDMLERIKHLEEVCHELWEDYDKRIGFIKRLDKVDELLTEVSTPEPIAHAKAWCSIHSCSPHDCFYEHNPSAKPGKVWDT